MSPAAQTRYESPFPGLRAFTEAETASFRGRGAERRQLFDCVTRDRLTVVFGRSGLGKTSLLQAGLAPALRADAMLPILVRMDFGSGAPAWVAQLRPRIDAELAAHDVELDGWTDAAALRDCLQSARFWSADQALLTPVLIFDQFEEIFTLGKGNPRVDAFARDLADLVERPRGARVKIVLALREDHLADLEAFGKFLPSLALNRFRLTPMDGVKACRAVMGTGGERVDDAVARLIVQRVSAAGGALQAATTDAGEDLANLEVEPAMLGLFCRELDLARHERGKDAQITRELVEELKGSAYANFYERLVASRDRSVASFIEDKLLTESGHRTMCALAEADHAVKGGAGAIRELEDERLLRIEQRLGQPHVEIIHDVLIPKIKERGDRRRARRALQRRALAPTVSLLFALTGVAGWQWWTARQQATRAEIGEREAKVARADAERNRELAEAAATQAEEDRRKAVTEKERADQAAKQAHLEREKADSAAKEATAQKERAENERKNAEANLEDANLQRKLAEESSRKSQEARDEAEKERERAKAEQKRAEAAVETASAAVAELNREFARTEAVKLAAQAELAAVMGAREREAIQRSIDALGGQEVEREPQVVAALLSSLASAQRSLPLTGHTGAVLHAALSPDGRTAVTAGEDGTVRVWTSPSWKEWDHGRIEHVGRAWHAEFSPKGDRVVSAGQDGAAWLWTLGPPHARVRLPAGGRPIFHAAFSPDGRFVATAGGDGAARVHSIEDPAAAPRIVQHEGAVWHVEFSPDGERLVTASSDDTACVWEWRTQTLVRRIRHTNAVRFAAFSPDGSLVVSAGDDGVPRITVLASRAEISLPGGGFPLTQARFQAADKGEFRLVTAGLDATAGLWRTGAGSAVEKTTQLGTLRGHGDWVRSAVFSTDAARILTASADGTARLWTGTPLAATVLLDGHAKGLRSGALARDDARRAVTASDDGTARVWTLPTDAQLGARSERFPWIATIEFASETSEDLRVWVGEAGDAARPPGDVAGRATLHGHRGWVWLSLLEELTQQSAVLPGTDAKVRHEWTVPLADLRSRAEGLLGSTPPARNETR